jgi:hypothetical protein
LNDDGVVAVVTLTNGDNIFCEFYQELDENGMLTLENPYYAHIVPVPGGTTLAMRPMVPYSDATTYRINPESVLTISALDEQHLSYYGQVLLNNALKEAQAHISYTLDNVITTNVGEELDNSFGNLIVRTAKIGLKYGIPLPDIDDLKEALVAYTFHKLPPSETSH